MYRLASSTDRVFAGDNLDLLCKERREEEDEHMAERRGISELPRLSSRSFCRRLQLFSAGSSILSSSSPLSLRWAIPFVVFLLQQQRRRCSSQAAATATALAPVYTVAKDDGRGRNGLPFRFCCRGSLR